jgi:hypothetical protein
MDSRDEPGHDGEPSNRFSSSRLGISGHPRQHGHAGVHVVDDEDIGLAGVLAMESPDVLGLRWCRDLGADLDAVKSWGADLVVSLIEDHEFEKLAIPTLAAEVRAGGMEWIHPPIRDVSVPNAKFDAAWPAASARLGY